MSSSDDNVMNRSNSIPFSPSIWNDYLMSNISNSFHMDMKENNDDDNEIIILELKKEVKKKIIELDYVENRLETLEFIDSIQRLGVSYYFENEIEAVLKKICNKFHEENNDDDDLYVVALRFRLVRQQGYNMSCDVFNKFTNKEGKFEESLCHDIRGMLSLYEAAQLRVHEEKMLDDALIFTTTHLECIAKTSQLTSPLSGQVNHALKHPIRKSLQRSEARHYMSIYHQFDPHNEHLLNLAILDFNLLQKLYQKELSDVTRWWKEFDDKSKKCFSRDRIMGCYFWTVEVFYEAEYSQGRIFMCKFVAMMTLIDDIYDNYATLEELQILTQAIQRWDICMIEKLPEYIKPCYKQLLNLYVEIQEFTKDRSYECASYAKKALQELVKGYLHEAKWFDKKYIPRMDEYMPIALITAGSPALIAMAFIGLGDNNNINVTKQSMDWIFSNPHPKIIRTMSTVGRIMNDIGYHKLEERRLGHIVASSVDCYIKQYGVTEEEAIEKLNEQVSDSWKDLNEDLLYPTTIPLPLLRRVLNLVHVNHQLYIEGDGLTQESLTKYLIDSIIINPYIKQ